MNARPSKKERIDLVWQAYLSASRALPLNLSWRDFCEKDASMFADYLVAERAIQAEKEAPVTSPKEVPS